MCASLATRRHSVDEPGAMLLHSTAVCSSRQTKDALEVHAFPSALVFLPLANMLLSIRVLEECTTVLQPPEPPVSEGRRGKAADEYCMIREREMGQGLLLQQRSKQMYTLRRCF